ncbi:hypothetical protein [Nocardioides sp.]|uniref:hypothetical protein n=1 Tax=Nocardioides sp. TaxID=35761 RepID=UPI0025D103C6|nr:hypothetical protein [Nocardioides sp.]
MNPLTVNPAIAIAHLRERSREEDARRCSGGVDRAIRAARSARTALERAGA